MPKQVYYTISDELKGNINCYFILVTVYNYYVVVCDLVAVNLYMSVI